MNRSSIALVLLAALSAGGTALAATQPLAAAHGELLLVEQNRDGLSLSLSFGELESGG